MTHPVERMTKLLSYPYGSYLMVRLEFACLCQDELEAMVLRLIEMHVENARKQLYYQMLNDVQEVTDETVLDVPRSLWVPISYRSFLYDLYGLVQSENTLKKALKSLVAKQFIFTRYEQHHRYDTPEYMLNIPYLEKELARLAKLSRQGYQKLIPSTPDTLNNGGRQVLIPSEGQKLIPSTPKRGSTRGSVSDTNRKKDSRYNHTEEQERENANESSHDEHTQQPDTSLSPDQQQDLNVWLEQVCQSHTSLPIGDPFGDGDEEAAPVLVLLVPASTTEPTQQLVHAPVSENSPDRSKGRVPEPSQEDAVVEQSSIPIATGTMKPSTRQTGQSPTHPRGGASSSRGRSNVLPLVTQEELALRAQLQAKIDEWRGYTLRGNAPPKEVQAEESSVNALAHKLYQWEVQHNPEGYSWKELDDLRKDIAINDPYWSKPENKRRIGGFALFQMSAQVILGKFRKQRQHQSGSGSGSGEGGTGIATIDTSVKLGGYSYVQDDGAVPVYMPRRKRAN